MADLIAVSVERHLELTWQRPENLLHAAKDAVIPLTYNEVPRAMPTMAIAFIENDASIVPVALQGFVQGRNRYVSDDGRWLGEYVPVAYRAHPFRLARNQNGEAVLGIDEEAGKVSRVQNGERFFSVDGIPAPAVAEILKLLSEAERDRQLTKSICEHLRKCDLLEPWILKAQEGDKVVEPTGILRIAEPKLYTLTPTELTDLRNAGALMLAFAQLLSMQQVHRLGKLGNSQNTPSGKPKLNNEHGVISFANL